MSGSRHFVCFGFPVVIEEAPVKVSDSRGALVADKTSVNSSVSVSLQGARMTDRQRLEGLQDVTEEYRVTE